MIIYGVEFLVFSRYVIHGTLVKLFNGIWNGTFEGNKKNLKIQLSIQIFFSDTEFILSSSAKETKTFTFI